jgi:hypothetical protein
MYFVLLKIICIYFGEIALIYTKPLINQHL